MVGHQAAQNKKLGHTYVLDWDISALHIYSLCIDMKLDGIVGVGTCYGLDGLRFDPSRCKKLSSLYSSRPAHLVPLQWLLGLFPVWCWLQLLASFCRPFAWHWCAAASGQIFMKFDNEIFFENVLKKNSSLINWWITGMSITTDSV